MSERREDGTPITAARGTSVLQHINDASDMVARTIAEIEVCESAAGSTLSEAHHSGMAYLLSEQLLRLRSVKGHVEQAQKLARDAEDLRVVGAHSERALLNLVKTARRVRDRLRGVDEREGDPEALREAVADLAGLVDQLDAEVPA